MILGDLSDTKRVEALNPLLGKLFSYIKEHDFLSDSIGLYRIGPVIEFSSTTIIRYYVLNRNRL